MRIRVGDNSLASVNGDELKAALGYFADVKKTFGKKAAGRFVGRIGAEVTGVFADSWVRYSGDAYSWMRNRKGKLQYGTKGRQYPLSMAQAWSQSVHFKGRAMYGGGKRMMGFGVDGEPYLRTAWFTSFPLNLWENDVHYTAEKGWGPWKPGMTRPGIHMMQRFRPEVERIIPWAVQKAMKDIEAEEKWGEKYKQYIKRRGRR